jgi:hypothetical protein
MLRIAKKTRLSPESTIDKAIYFFGPKGYGLVITEQGPSCAKFEGMGGTVEVSTCVDGKKTSVEVITTNWEKQTKEFLSII